MAKENGNTTDTYPLVDGAQIAAARERLRAATTIQETVDAAAELERLAQALYREGIDALGGDPPDVGEPQVTLGAQVDLMLQVLAQAEHEGDVEMVRSAANTGDQLAHLISHRICLTLARVRLAVRELNGHGGDAGPEIVH
jgi:hypothetical protein